MNDLIFDQIRKGEPVIIEGYLLKDEKSEKSGFLSIQLFPGMVISLDKKDTSSIEQATDPVTGRTFIKLSLANNAEVKSLFQLKLARMAISMQGEGVPLVYDENCKAVYTEMQALRRPSDIGGLNGGISVVDTYSYCKSLYMGWYKCDKF